MRKIILLIFIMLILLMLVPGCSEETVYMDDMFDYSNDSYDADHMLNYSNNYTDTDGILDYFADFVDTDDMLNQFEVFVEIDDSQEYSPILEWAYRDETHEYLPILEWMELEGIPERSPSLYIYISADGLETQHFRAAQGTTSWSPAFAFTDRIQIGDTIQGGMGYEATGFHPLDFWQESWVGIDLNPFMVSLKSIDGEIEISLSFHFPPTSVYLKRWSADYIGMSSEMWNDYEPIELSNNVFRVSSGSNDYIYEVVASWTRGDVVFGRVFYTFRLECIR